MNQIILEIKAAEGGNDSKLLVTDMLGVYAKVAQRRGL